MKKLLLIFTLLTAYLLPKAQPYGNEWIDYNQTHWKISISQDGLYRIPFGLLNNSISGFQGLNLQSLALYHNGEEVPMYFSTTNPADLNGYILFYGKKNIGDVDSVLYKSTALQPHIYTSLYTDASIYYLTIRIGANNRRYVETANDLNNLPAKENYFTHTVREVYNGRYYEGKYYTLGNCLNGDEVYKSTFEEGEGFVNNAFFGSFASNNPLQQTSINVSLQTPYAYSGGPQATLNSVYANNWCQSNTVVIDINNTNVLSQTNYAFKFNKFNYNFSPTLLSANSTVRYSTTGSSPSRKQNALYMTEVSYPRQFDFRDASGTAQNKFYFILKAGPRKYLEVTGFNDEGNQPFLLDITTGLIIRSTQPAGSTTLRFAVPSSVVDREFYLVNGGANTYSIVQGISAISFTNYADPANQAEYAIIYNSVLNSDGAVGEYRNYRASHNFNSAQIYNIDQLYEQFAYGIRKSPLAIRNFIRYATEQWGTKPTHVLLMGKGREYNVMRNNSNVSNQCLIPTFGYPGSDNLLAATRSSDTVLVSIGRLAVDSIHQIRDYLDKVKQYETEQATYTNTQTIPEKIWQKQVLHFSGGTSTVEQSNFKNYNNGFAIIARDTLWGANITSFSRNSASGPIDESMSQIIKGKINEGVSWLTFFGHSATGAFDFSIDEPERYTNVGKYPVILSNGCFSGLIHDATKGYSERFVLSPQKGSIAFIATTSLSLPSGLKYFSDNLYRNFTSKQYINTLGVYMRSALRDVYNTSTDNMNLMVSYEMTLHGDPGIKVNQYPRPDYAIDETSLYFNPTTITPGVDTFTAHLVVTNLGKAIKDSINVSLTRRVFDQANNNNPVTFTHILRVKAPYYQDTVAFRIPTRIDNVGYGENQFMPFVDYGDSIVEMAEGNNGSQLQAISIFIQSDDVVPIYPYEFAIVPKQGVTLKASTINPFAPTRNYLFQIDTTEKFNSQQGQPMQQLTVFQSGGVLHATPNITYQDSMVYYWRVAIDSSTPAWRYSSFIYLKDEYPGWNQSHVYQWLKDSYQQMSIDSTTRVFKFPPTANEIRVTTGRAQGVGGAWTVQDASLGWDYNNVNMHRFRMGGCGFNTGGLTFAVIDNVTGFALASTNTSPHDDWGDKFGNYHCSDKAALQYGFDFRTEGPHPTLGIDWDQVIANFIDSIPANSYVLIYSQNSINYANWSTILTDALQRIGFTENVTGGQFVFFNQKGNPNYVPHFASVPNNGPLNTNITFNGVWTQGNFTSPPIGPAFEWGSMHWSNFSVETPSQDRDTVDIIGINTAGIENVILSTTQPNNFIQNISASTYPYIRLRLRTKDTALRTPTQMKYWRVLYKKAPEAAMNPAAHFVFTDSLALGGNMNIEIGLENVTDIDMDSMLTHFTIRDAQLTNYEYDIRFDSLRALDILHLKLTQPITSSNYNGLNKVFIEANPNDDQLEQFHFNNYAELNFKTIGDNINPLLDVTFDGQHIFNGDIVSSKPNILITLKDENPFMALNDTALVNVYLKYPNDPTPRRIAYDGVNMKFYPADSNNLTSKNNKAQIEFAPLLDVDGKYELIVKDRDRSGNNSSSTTNRSESNVFYDYKISFEVINKSMVTNVLNYPNPFTTATKFVFTITGSEIPDYMKIQIMTIKGTVVKEITKDELGPMHIGRNITEYTWNGRDEFGDLLANGVYFYRVVTKLDNKQMDHMGQGYDKYFKKGFGKLVIVR